MKRMKRGLAVALMLLLMVPTQPLMAISAAPLEAAAEQESGRKAGEEKLLANEEKKEEKTAGKQEEASEKEETKEREEGKEKEEKEEEEIKENVDPKEDVETPTEEKDKEETEDPTDSKEEKPAEEKKETEEKPAGDEKKEDQKEPVEEEEKEEQKAPAGEEEKEDQKDPAGEEEKKDQEDQTDQEEKKEKQETIKENPDEDEEPMDEEDLEKEEEILEGLLALLATPSELEREVQEEVIFNTGSHGWHVVSPEDFENGFGDVEFDEDGNYTIQIPEENPFFPYEVQFTYQGKTTNRWFMTPEDSVEIGGHDFFVSAYFDGTVVTQMSMEVAGDTVVVYPEKKEFTDDGDGASPMSLLPLEERELNVDMTGYTPAELTRISVDWLLGNDKLQDTDKVMWVHEKGIKAYRVSQAGDTIDLSWNTCGGGEQTWQMIVGEDNQLADGNIRYILKMKVTESRNWLVPTVYKQDRQGNRSPIATLSGSGEYEDVDVIEQYGRELDIEVGSGGISPEDEIYVGLRINPDVFRNPNYSRIEVHYDISPFPDDVVNSPDITDQFFAPDMTATDAGLLMWVDGYYTSSELIIVTYDQAGEMTGYLPITINLNLEENALRLQLYDGEGAQRVPVTFRYACYPVDGYTIETDLGVEAGYPLNKEYYLVGRYHIHDRDENNALVTAAFEGEYSSIAEAVNAGAVDIKDKLFDQGANGGYKADYSQGVSFTIFVGEDGSKNQEIFRTLIKAERDDFYEEPDAWVTFEGLQDAQGNSIDCYLSSDEHDSYGDGNYQLILVGENTDLTKLSPVFSTAQGVRLRLPGSQVDEISGESIHDFSKGALHYTAVTDKDTKNYWLHIIKAESEEGKLYINSLDDEQSHTREEAGVIYSTREMCWTAGLAITTIFCFPILEKGIFPI